MESRITGNHADILGQELQSESTAPSTANSLATIVDIILSTQNQKFESQTIRDLRLTCKATKYAVDTHVQTFEWKLYDRPEPPLYVFHEISWRWPNVNRLNVTRELEEGIGPVRRQISIGVQQDVEYLLTLPLLKLTSLTVECHSVMPLVHSNWPMLTHLELRISQGKSGNISYPKDLQFPGWPLKKFELVVLCDNLRYPWAPRFLGSLLKSYPELTELELFINPEYLEEETATIIVSAPLERLKTLIIQHSPDQAFCSTMFAKDWKALQVFHLKDIVEGSISPLSSAIWVKNVKEFNLEFDEYNDVGTVDELQTFFKAIENGAVENLSLRYLPFSMLSDAIKGIKLENLKLFKGHDLFTYHLGPNADVSDWMNVFFESCSFPKLERIVIALVEHYKNMPSRWIQSPRLRVKQLIDVCPLLKDISLSALGISREVADYLGTFRRVTGCQIEIIDCQVTPKAALSPEHQRILTKLDLDSQQWVKCCHDYIGIEFYRDCFFWDSMSTIQFKRISYAALLLKCTDSIKLDTFLKLVEAEEEGNVMTAEVLEFLKSYLKRMRHDASRWGIELQLTWKQLSALIDYRMLESLENNI